MPSGRNAGGGGDMSAPAIERPAGGYRFICAVSQHSAGVAAKLGFRIERLRFVGPLPMALGWKPNAARLDAAKRPRAAACACELRSPAPFTADGFRAFNSGYAEVLSE